MNTADKPVSAVAKRVLWIDNTTAERESRLDAPDERSFLDPDRGPRKQEYSGSENSVPDNFADEHEGTEDPSGEAHAETERKQPEE